MSMETEFNAQSGEAQFDCDLASAQQTDLEDPPPRELESALLSIALFGGLIVFGVGCMLFIGW